MEMSRKGFLEHILRTKKDAKGYVLNIHHKLYVVDEDEACLCAFTDGGTCKYYGCPIFAMKGCNVISGDIKPKKQYIFKEFTNV